MAGAAGREILFCRFLAERRQRGAFERGKGRISFRKGRRPGNGHCIFVPAAFFSQQGRFCFRCIL